MPKKKHDKIRGMFVPMPTHLLQSKEWASLSPIALKAIMAMLARFTGFNNGDLAAEWAYMRERGFRSKGTLARALRELVEAQFIAVTRQGGRRVATLYGVTWLPLTDDWARVKKFDCTSANWPLGAWIKTRTFTPINGAKVQVFSSPRPRGHKGEFCPNSEGSEIGIEALLPS